GDTDRTAELVGGFPAGDDATEVGQGAVDHEPGLLRPGNHGLERAHLLRLDIARRHRAADTEHADTVNVAEIVLELLELRYRLEGDGGAAPVDGDRQRFAGADADDALHVGETSDRLAVDRHDEVARLEAGDLCGAVRLDGVDARGCGLLAGDHEDTGENHDGEDEIGDGAGSDNRRARTNRLEHEAVALFFFGHGRGGVEIGRACRVVIAVELHVAAERHRGDLPAGAVAIIEAEQLGTEADREGEHLNAAPASYQEVAKLMKENNNRQYKQERNHITRQPAAEGAQA